jgi:hypothetical protein
MVKKYSHMIIREDARQITLSDAIDEAKEDGEMILKLFNKFRIAWSEIGFDAHIKYGSKINLNIKDYNEQHYLSFFLLDN